MEAGSETFRGVFPMPSGARERKERSCLGDSGEKEGKEVKDLSDIDEAELEM
jgi:hypothetical protein